MGRLRNYKKILRQWLEAENWEERLEDIAQLNPREAAGPLFSFLLLGDSMTHKAARALGICINKLSEEKAEDARNLIRRFMWQMNEESGNIGWGIPEAFAETLVHNTRMAKEFHPVLLSYIMDTGRDDNFCDHDILRRSCFWSVGRLVMARPELCMRAIPWLIRGLEDVDIACRGLAAWALAKFPKDMLEPLEVVPFLRRLTQSQFDATTCSIFEDGKLNEYDVLELTKDVLKSF